MSNGRRYRALGALLVLAVAGCTGSSSGAGGTSGEPVTLRYWVYESSGPDSFDDTLVKDFEAANPNIKIEVTQFPYQNYDVKVQTAIAANKPPDLIFAFNLDFMRQGFLMPLDDMVTQYGIDLSRFNQAIVRGPGTFSCSLDGKLYCLGATQGGWSIFYNKDLFDAAGVPYPRAWPPMTVDEFADISCRLTDKANGVWGAAVPSTLLPWELSVSPDGRTVNGYLNSRERSTTSTS